MSIKRTLLVMLVASVSVVGCSSSKDKSRTNTIIVEVTAGQQDIAKALVRSSEILVTGMPNESNDGMLNYQSFYTEKNGTAKVAVIPRRLQLFELVTLPANKDINQDASVSRCQWVAGCEGGAMAFAESINPAYQWQSVVWGLSKGERVVVTPLTHLAAALAFEYAYAETPQDEQQATTESEWQKTGYYSPYSVEQAVSQVSQVFGVSNIQSTLPADLTKLNSISTKDVIEAKYSVRYGALLAAWAHLQEQDANFTRDVTNEFLENQGQVLQKEQDGQSVASLTLSVLYNLAATNLKNLTIHNSSVKSLVSEVVGELEAEIDGFSAGQLTNKIPASIESIFGTTAFNEYGTGVKRAKAFVENLQDQSKYFFGDEYNGLINTYLDEQKTFFKSNKDNFSSVLNLLNDAQTVYIKSYNGSVCNDSSSWAVCDYSSDVLTLTDTNSHTMTLSMQNVTTNKQAVDIEMAGELQVGDLLFSLKNKDDSRSKIRLFYAEETDQVLASTVEPIGYEYDWASFSFHDTLKNDQEWTGNFSLLYRGVANPADATVQHFNIDTLRLSSRISNEISDDSTKGKETSAVFIAAKSSTADTFYNPNEKFGKINGFFVENAVGSQEQTKANLVSYKLGEEEIYGQVVKYFDLYVNDDSVQSFRYRFYPDVVRNQNAAGQYTVGNNDAITTHKMAICPLSKKEGGWVVDGTCSPTQIFNGKRNVQKSINAFWKAGAFSYVDLPAEGEYFIEWPAANVNGCFELEELLVSEAPVELTEPSTLVSAAVLGLDTLRITTEIVLEDKPFTLLDVLINAPKEDRYNITAALSHNYTAVNIDEVNIGTGNNLDRILFNYNTDSSFKRTGSFSVYKAGVSLFEGDSVVDAEVKLGLNQNYTSLQHKYVTASNGGQQICVTANQPFEDRDINNGMKESAVYSLSFRGVVYGSIRKENSMWIARFIDGTWIPLVP